MITIVTCTYFSHKLKGGERMAACCASIRSWMQLLEYPDINLHVADDGSDADLWLEFQARHQDIKVTYSQQHRRGIGASLNKGLAQAWANGGLALYIQDDLLLEEHLDLTFPATILESEPDIMAVRLLSHPDLTGRIRYIGGRHRRESMVLKLDPHHYAMSSRPFLAHRRMMRYGPYLEGASAAATEQDFNERYTREPSLKVVQWLPNPWFHQHVIDLGTIQPEGGV